MRDLQLYLAGNSIGPRGSAQLFAALACNQGLRSLYLVRLPSILPSPLSLPSPL